MESRGGNFFADLAKYRPQFRLGAEQATEFLAEEGFVDAGRKTAEARGGKGGGGRWKGN